VTHLELYNSLTRKKEPFVPIAGNTATIYVCGPTTYNFIHIGNARPVVISDVLGRFLEHTGYAVKIAQNLTDVDDKIIARAIDEGITTDEVAQKYINEFLVDVDGLNVRRADFYPRVTEEMGEIIAMIAKLMDGGYAYEKGGTVYFHSAKSPNYGALSKKNIDDLQAGARVDVNTDKEHFADFVLWKPAKPGEPAWSSPWGDGRPGWHIECSAMIKKYLGATIDIHCGGEDLAFPHHENEIAQSQAANGAPLANCWLHNGMINVDDAKMSKSEGNFFLVRDIAQRFSYNVIRFFVLSAHYRSPLNFSDELMDAAKAAIERIRNCHRSMAEAFERAGDDGEAADTLEPFVQDFIAFLNDDLNTANAITAIFDMVKFINKTKIPSRAFCEAALKNFDFMLDILGIDLAGQSSNKMIDEDEVNRLIEVRNNAKAYKDWARADSIRDKLLEMGVTIKDTREGTTWHINE